MLPSHRSRSQSNEPDDLEDDDLQDANAPRQASHDKLKRLALNLIGRWHWIVLGLILGVLGAYYYLDKTPKQYTAIATLLIKQQTSTVMSRNQPEDLDMRSTEAMNTVAERIRRMDLLERVAKRELEKITKSDNIKDLKSLVPAPVNWIPTWIPDWLSRKLGKDEPGAESAQQGPPSSAVLASMIASWLEVSIRRGTRLLDISITHPNPDVAKNLANAIATEYWAETRSVRAEGRIRSIDLLKNQLKETSDKLQSGRSALSSYARTLEVHKALDAKESEVAGLQRRYLPKHPRMITADAELKDLQEQFIKAFDVARQSASDKTFWEEHGKELPDQQTHPEEFLRTARQQLLARIGVLDNDISTLTLVYNNMTTKKTETSVDQESDESDTEMNNEARTPGMPSAPVRIKVIAIGTVGGLAIGLILAMLFIRLDNKYHTVAQVAGETGVTVLAAIADINPNHLAAAERLHRKRNPDEKIETHSPWDSRLVFRPGASSTSYAEMFRVLRASITLLGDETKRKITLFSSALPGEGKTSISANYAAAAAGQGRKTLLIDLDLRKPSVHKFFGLPREQEKGGMTECLANLVSFDDVILRETCLKNLDIILSGKNAPNPGELLDTGRLKTVLSQACRDYDVVVLDTAPLLAVPDTRIVAPLAHNVCLVVRADYVPKGAVHRVLEVMDEDGTALSGVIFNAFKERRLLIGENYSYGSYQTSRYGRSYRYGYGSYGNDRKK